jgi:hypothetical protein
MKTILLFITVFMGIAFTRTTNAQTVTEIDFDTINWVLPDNYQITEFQGNQALLIEGTGDNGSDPYAYLKDYVFSDGIIEFDLFCPPSDVEYVGFIFRLNQHKEEDRYELFYFRPFMSGSVGAVQYIPVNNGEALFQYYTDNIYQSGGNIPLNKWNHVKAEVEGPRAIVYVNDKEVMTVNNLGRGLSNGSIGFWKDSTTPKCYYANLKVTI